jgi:hypothetical protein
MVPTPTRSRLAVPLALAALGLSACGTSVATSKFSGEQHAVAQAIANLQADATASEHGKICKNDLAAEVVTRLGGVAGCERAIKDQLAEVENLEVSIDSVQIGADGTTATATVKSTYSGTTVSSTVSLVKEQGRWRVSAL